MKITAKTKSYKVGSLSKMIFIFILLNIAVGCNEDNMGPVIPEPVEPEPIVVETNAYASPESIAYAGSTTVLWTSKNVTSVTLNDAPVSINGSKNLENLKNDTIFVVKFFVESKQVSERKINIKVASPIVVIPTRTDTICGRYWMLASTKNFSQGNWYTVNIDEDRLTRKLYFYKNGLCEVFKKNGDLIGNGYWNFIGQDSIKIGGPTYEYQLTDTIFVRRYEYENEISIDVYKGYKINQ